MLADRIFGFGVGGGFGLQIASRAWMGWWWWGCWEVEVLDGSWRWGLGIMFHLRERRDGLCSGVTMDGCKEYIMSVEEKNVQSE